MVTIIDYRTGNIGSIMNMLKKIGAESILTSEKNKIATATKIILPGVGAFDTGMKNLQDLDLIDVLNQKVIADKVPVLGICLGLQLFSNKSEEGLLPGLGWIDAETRRFEFKDTSQFKSPHMGWNYISLKKESRLFNGMYPDARFYFVHSYYLSVSDSNDVLTSTSYELEFTSAIERGNISGVQFHPEKSHKFGMKLLKNFIDLY
jgi:imidazole glycerol-phosphate synthase subunit HisH